MYYGKDTQLIDNDQPHTVRVVQMLVEPFHNKGYDLYVDRFHFSSLLATELNKVGITITGTQYQVHVELYVIVNACEECSTRFTTRDHSSSAVNRVLHDRRRALTGLL